VTGDENEHEGEHARAKETAGQRRRGRPRSEAARRAILDAAMAELTERGYAELTTRGIAARAGVGKQTIYRWWTSKADVVFDAILDRASSWISVPDSGSLDADLSAFLAATFRRREMRPALVGLMAQALLDPEFATMFRERFLFSRRAALRDVLRRAVERGEIDGAEELELLIDVVYGVLWYRLLVGHAPITEETGRELAALIMRAVWR
jgi:AcrR family transcriptional regulator